MTTEPTEPSQPTEPKIPATLDEVRSGRADLHEYMQLLEEAVAKPLPGRSEVWAKHVHETLIELGASFERHIAITERPDGLFEDLTKAAPRLAGGVSKLAEEHREIRAAIGAALDAVRDRASVVSGDGDLDGREAVLDLINRLMRHRQRGADLIYEAYQVDVGGGD